MPEEVFSERNKMADDGTLTKVITYDIIRQTRRSAGVASVDADNCYDRIAHAIASLVFQAFGAPLSASESMLTTIQEMKLFLRTGFGDSTDFASSTLSIKTHGLCQGNVGHPQQNGCSGQYLYHKCTQEERARSPLHMPYHQA